MIILALESATVGVGACLYEDDGLLASFSARPGRRHVETLHPEIAAITQATGVALSDVDVIGIDIGPGLFTGLRVGITTARSLGFALSIPLVGLRSTEILHFAARGLSASVVPVIDMRRGDVAWEIAGGGGAVMIGPPGLLAESIVEHGGEHLLVGDGARRYFPELEAMTHGLGGEAVQLRAGPDELDAPPVEALAQLALRRYLDHGPSDPADLAPLYLRGPDAKVNFPTRQSLSSAPLLASREVAKAKR